MVCENVPSPTPPRVQNTELPLSESKLRRLHHDRCALRHRPLVQGLNIIDAHHDGMRHPFPLRGSTVSARIGDDHCPVAHGQLRPVVFADPYPLDAN